MLRLLVKWAFMLMLLALSACSTIKQWFPDKEKDYQHTTEIPELVLPPDLMEANAPMSPALAPIGPEAIETGAPAPSPDAVEAAIEPIAATLEKPELMASDAAVQPTEFDQPDPLSREKTTAPVSAENEQNSSQPISYPVEKINADGAAGLRIHAAFPDAWRAVEQALGRKSIAVNDQDEQEKQFAVRYNPDEHDIQDASFWDEVNFFWYGLRGKEKTYFLKLLDGGQWTDLRVLDAEQKPAKDAGAAELIALLEKTIRSGFVR